MPCHVEIVGRDGCLLSYHDCLMWAYRHKMDPQNRKSAVRIKRDKQRGGWKCCVTLYTR